LPVGNVPEIDFPTLVITASASGASPAFMERAVTNPLEEKLANIPGLEAIRSTTTLGGSTIILRFRLGRDMNEAANQAQSAIDEAASSVTPALDNPPVLSRFNPADQPVLLLGLRSPSIPVWELDDLAQKRLGPRLGTVPGVARVSLLGGSEKSVRVGFSPVLLAGHRLSASTMEKRLTAANANLPAGQLDGPARSVQLQNDSRLNSARDFEEVPLRSRSDGVLFLSDVAGAAEGSLSNSSGSWIGRDPGIVIAVRHSIGANSLQVARDIRAMLPLLQASIPAGATLEILADASLPVGESIRDLQFTLVVAVVLVVLVTLLFLGDFRSTLVTSLVVPASLAGTLGFMWLVSYSLDNLSLLALTLAVGFVVDDAVVVLENSHRLVEDGMSPMDAALTGASQIGFTILSMTLSLVAVFLPVLLMGGVVGRLFREFAITLSVAILLSGVIAMFFTPVVCARLIRPSGKPPRDHGQVGWLARLYLLTLRPVIAFPLLFLLAGGFTVFWTAREFMSAPKGFVPNDDHNRLVVWTRVNAGTSHARQLEAHRKLQALLDTHPAVERHATLLGVNEYSYSPDHGCLLLQLRSEKERGPIGAVRENLMALLNSEPGVMAQVVQPPSIPLATTLYPASLQFTLRDVARPVVDECAEALLQAMLESGCFTNLPGNPDLGASAVRVSVDGRMCGLLGIDPGEVNRTLQTAYAEKHSDTVYDREGARKLVVSAAPEYQRDLEQVGFLQVRARNGALVQMRQIANFENIRIPVRISHFNRFQSRTLTFDPAPGVTAEQSIAKVRELAARILARYPTVQGQVDGVAMEYSEVSGGFPALLLFALLVIYLILGILYESFIHPVTVLSGLPSACLGGLLVLRHFGLELDLYGFLGLLLLLGIVKKNAIMVIDFALERRRAGLSDRQAVSEACAVRLRPILMTTLAAIVGALPIALGWGAGADSRKPMGLVVVGGLLLSQVVTLYLTPAVFLCLAPLEKKSPPKPE
jgi:HAE1 family hydrophobic/amphiphilic exporter-1